MDEKSRCQWLCCFARLKFLPEQRREKEPAIAYSAKTGLKTSLKN
jgi:hypothetical protein